MLMIVKEAQEEFVDMVNDSTAKDAFAMKSMEDFWCGMKDSYPQLTDIAIKVLLPFASTYLCESGFSTLLAIKCKARNKLQVEDDLRCALATTAPRFEKLVRSKQAQKSH